MQKSNTKDNRQFIATLWLYDGEKSIEMLMIELIKACDNAYTI